MVPRFIFLRGAFPRAVLPTLTGLGSFVFFAAAPRPHSSLGSAQPPFKSAKTKAKEPAPRFNARTTDGEKFSNDSVKGKVVLLEFWTTWCGFCAEEAPLLDKIGREFADRGLIVLAVNVGESKKTVKKYLDLHPRNCKIVLMEDTNLAAMYVATVYPIYVVIDRDGFVSATQRGAGGEDALRDLLASAGLESPSDADSEANGNQLCWFRQGAALAVP